MTAKTAALLASCVDGEDEGGEELEAGGGADEGVGGLVGGALGGKKLSTLVLTSVGRMSRAEAMAVLSEADALLSVSDAAAC